MTPLRLFVSSVQREFAEERAALRDYLRGDPLMRRFFEAFLFEDVPATDRRPDALYLEEVERCDLYVGLFGLEYGSEDDDGVSPTEREFDRAEALGKHRLIFVKGGAGETRHPSMQTLIDRAQADLVRRRFNTPTDLVAGLYAALVEYLEGRELLRWGPFDAAPCTDAAFDDLDPDRMTGFIGAARRARQFPLADEAPPEALLEHLNLLNRDRPTNAAVLLFGKRPQRFLISSTVKCAHFHGTRVGKPIPSHQVYQGTVFELVDHAVDFVLGKIALSVGTRAESVQAPVAYEIPKEVVTEAIVNAVAHRDYTSDASVQVMLFADRLEIWNPGTLPPPLTLDKLRVPHESVPGNPLLARAMYLVKYIEQMGTGTLDMIARCVEAGLREPEFEATGTFVTRILRAAPAGQPVVFTDKNDVRGRARDKAESGQLESEQLESGQLESGQLESEQLESLRTRVLGSLVAGPLSKAELSDRLGQKQASGQLHAVVRRLVADRLIEYTVPDKPGSRLQKYRLTETGRATLARRAGQGTGAADVSAVDGGGS